MNDENPSPEEVTAPEKPLEFYLQALREHGFTVLDHVVSEAALKNIRQATYAQIALLDPAPPAFDDRFGVPNGIAWSADICRAVTHPVALALIRAYMETEAIHFCHQPAMTVLRPAKDLIGEHPESGWHSDYPYHPDVYPEDRWADDAVYGVQFNICIDDFRADNAGTQFVPNSHRLKRYPPKAMNEGGTKMGVAPHENVAQMLAPAGSALIYDSRMWHRASPELNISGQDRLAILNAVCPSWVRPMVDKKPGMKHFGASNMAAQLAPSVREELTRLCLSAHQAPPVDAPVILEKPDVPRRIAI
ncbi:MAG: phytanoyl-CoA dioxygenase family protein [Pseudomonadales bacterium]|jgi:ectoine hydroxylase-related dioxygenase (phytanoyl-CoA dioxygenase family)|nr:phytanoyl-CoA dioxygenase family protein [Pseudomonadales bacterium]MDA0956832.1 phytanoyl-CoA dioxygenase family protein [Pseudomonadota bacterium]MDA1207266.1 phytanoyl-CoA dioxygenase family protein [Pseudomonadota bacterium]